MKDSLLCPFQHRQGLATSSSVYNRINLVIHGGIPRNPPSQVSFAQPTVVHHFDPYGTPGNNSASTAYTTHVPTTPRRTVDYPSFPTYHTPSMAFGSSDADLLMADIAQNAKSTDPFSHIPPHVPLPPCSTTHTGSPAVSTLPTFCGKPVNLAPVSGSVPPLSGPPHGPSFGTSGHPSPLAPPPAPTGPPPYHGTPVPPPPGPLIPPSGPPTCTGFPTPPPGPPIGVSTGSMPFLHGIDWREHRVNPTKLEDNVVASTCTIQPWIFNCPEVGSTINHGV